MRNLLAIILLVLIGFFVGRQDSERMKKLIISVAEALIESEQQQDDGIEVTDTEVAPLNPRGNRILRVGDRVTDQVVSVYVEDEFGVPLGNVCLILRQGTVQLGDSKFTDSAEGMAIFALDQVAEGEEVQLVLEPVNHSGAQTIQRNTKTMIVAPALFGGAVCFRRLSEAERNSQGKDFEQIVCQQLITQASEPAEETSAEPLDDSKETAAKSSADLATPFMLSDNFDYDRKEWDFPTDQAGFDVFIDDGALVLNNIIKQNFRLSKTSIPIGWDLKNFALSADIKSMVQPQNAEDTGRLSLLFREQDDGRYYILSIDQSGHSTIYFVRPGDDGLNDLELVESWNGTEHGFDANVNAVNHLHLTANGNLITVQFNDAPTFEIVDKHNFLSEAGGMSLGLDGSEGNLVSYRLDNLTIHEWSAD